MKAIKTGRWEIKWVKWFRRELIVMSTLYFFCASMAFANPYGAQIVHGNVGINAQGNKLTVTNSPNSIIHWQGFSINNNEAVRFIQQSSSSAVLNRVMGQDPSRILGLLQSNGRVFLINPNGILFGQGARIDVNGLVASTLNIGNQDFLAGRYNFTAGAVAGPVKNEGTITTPEGGKVYLIAPDIENSGIINTPKGDIILAAGHSVQLVDSLDPDISVVVSAPEDKAVNLGQIMAQSGNIGIYGGLIQQKGIVSADSAVVGRNGKIFFKAAKDITLDTGSQTSANGPQGGEIKIRSEAGTTLVSGTVAAIGNDGKGGDIQILGNQVGLIDHALIDASGKTGGGTVLIGGDYQGKNPAVQNAEATYVGKNTAVTADAIENGDGGKVIVWSDKATRVYGAISANGGMDGGNGGFVETSSKQYLDITQAADASAPSGKAGVWLLDPNNITIVAGAFGAPTNLDESPAGVFNTNDDGAQITNGTITQALNAGTSVSLTTGTAGSNLEAGDITVNAPISKFTGGDTSLTLSAANNININQSVTSSIGKLNLTVIADSDATGGGATNINANINTNGGGLTATGGSGTVNLTGGTVTLDGVSSIKNLNMSSGMLTGSGALTLSGASTWTGGTISMGGSGSVTVLPSTTLALSGDNDKILGSGNLTIAGQAEWAGAGNLYLNNAGQFTIQSGGLFDIKTDADIHYNSGGVPTFTNAGMLRKSAGTDATVIGASVPFNFVNSGTLDAQTGILNFSGNNAFNNGSTFTGAGINRITTGAVFSGALISTNLDLAGGTFSGTATLSGTTNWSGGTIGGNAVLTIPSGSALNMANSGSLTISNATLMDQGTITWTGAGNLYLNDAGQFTIPGGGLFDIQTDADIYYTAGGVPTFTNAGMLRKSAGTDVTVIGAASPFNFVNSGTLDAQTGILNFSGNNAFNNGSTFTGAGTNRITTGAVFSGALTSANLDLAGGTFSGTATLSGATNWSGGTIGGNGVLTIPSGSALNMANSGSLTISNATLMDQGTITWTGAGNLYLNNAGQFTIPGGGLFDIQTDADIYYTAGGVPTFTNAGMLRKSAGTDVTVIGAASALTFNNAGGAIDVTGGSLQLNAAASFSGSTNVTGGTVQLTSGGGNITGSLNIGSGATMDFAGGTTSFTGTTDFTGSGSLLLSGATWGGSGNVDVGSPMTWTGGAISVGGSGSVTVLPSTTLALSGSNSKILNGGNLTIAGQAEWAGAGNLYLNNAGQLTIPSSGLFDIKTDADIYYTAGAVPTFTNAGMLRKSAGADATVIGAASPFNFVNSGTLDAQTGILNFAGNNAFNNGSVFTGAGINRITAGAAFSGALTSANLDLAGGTFSGTATLSGATNWSGGTIGGNGVLTIPSGSALNMANSGSLTISNATLMDQGTITWTGAGNLYLNDAAQFTIPGGGLFDIKTDADIYYTAGGTPTFTNAGMLRKSSGTDATVIGAASPFSVNNSGAIDVLTGTIDVTGTFSSTGPIDTLSGATFKKIGGFINSGTISGMGTIDVGAGNTLTNNGTINPGGAGMAGSLAITGNLVQGSSGIVNMDIAGTTPGMQYDELTVSGNATLNGTLNIAHVGGYTPYGRETFNVINSAGNTGSFAAINPPAPFTYTPTYGATVLSLAFGRGSGTDSWLWNADGSWDDPYNWSLGTVPVAGQNVIIDCPSSLCTVTIPGAYSAVAGKITSSENLTIAGGNLSLTAGANSSLFGSDTTLYLIGGGTINIGSGATLTAYNLNLANGDIGGPGSLIVSNGFSQSAGGTIGNTTPVFNIHITQAAGNLVIADLLKASGKLSLTASATINQTAPIAAAGLELLGTGGTYNLNTAANAVTTLAGNTGSVNFTNSGALSIGTVNGTAGLTTTGNIQVVSGGDLTLSGLVDAGTGTVSLNTSGAIVNNMGGATSISADTLSMSAANGIGNGNPLMTAVHNLTASNSAMNNIKIDNTGVLTVTALSNGGTGNVALKNIGALTTDISTVTSGGALSIITYSPLTIGTGGVTAFDSVTLEASPSGGADNLTVNGNIASANGDILLSAGSSIVVAPGAVLSAPYGTITMTEGLNGAPTHNLAATGNETATNSTVSSLMTAMGKITSDENGDDENELKKKASGGGPQSTDEKKMDENKNYCN